MSKDARRPALAISLVAAWLVLVLSAVSTLGATYTTPNFVVTAPTDEFAKQVGVMAEQYRDQIAIEWLGKKLPNWSKPCPIRCRVGQIGAGGATTFCFDRGHVFGWNMNIQGTEERILDSVLPHEISHTIFACHFRRPLPRWADEGAATLVEHESERRRQVMLLNQVLQTNERIPLKQLLPMKDYPKDMRQVLTLYAEGYALAEYFVQQGGRTRYLQFLEDAHNSNWDQALRKHYRISGVAALEESWGEWVVAGMPTLKLRDGEMLAQNDDRNRPARRASGRDGERDAVIRSQTPDDRGRDALALNENSRPQELEAPQPRSRRASNDGLANDDRRDSRRSKLGNDGWAEEERLPRPQPLIGRIEYANVAADRLKSPVGEVRPEFTGEADAEASEEMPDFDESLEPAPGARSAEIPSRDSRLADAAPGGAPFGPDERPDFEESLEDSSVADPRPSDWSAFPQARTTPGATPNGSNSPFSP